MGQMKTCDVAIVGLGPTGAVLANLLGKEAGCTVVGLEREQDLYYLAARRTFRRRNHARLPGSRPVRRDRRHLEPFTEMEFLLKAGGPPAMRSKIGSQDFRYGHHGAWWYHQPTLERHFHDGLKRFPNVTPLIWRGSGDRHYAGRGWCDAALPDARRCRRRRSAPAMSSAATAAAASCARKRKLPLDTADFDEAWVVVDTRTRSGAKHPDLPKNHRQVCDPEAAGHLCADRRAILRVAVHGDGRQERAGGHRSGLCAQPAAQLR